MSMTVTEYARLKRLANRAAELTCDADFKEMLTDLKNRSIRGWADTRANEQEAREKAWHDLGAVGRLEDLMKAYGEALRMEDRKNGR